MATYTSNYAWTKPSGSDPVDISVLNGNLDSQDGIIHDAFLNMAVPFSELSTYTVGNIVLYGTKTYKCRVPVTTPGSWTGSTNWDEYKLSEGGLTAGNYVNIQNGVINVQTEIGTYDNIRYNFTPTNGGYYVTVTVYVNDVQRFQQSYHNDDLNGHPVVIEDLIEFWYGGDGYYWHYMPLIDSNEHPKDTDIRWYYNEMAEHEETFAVSQDDSTTLVTKGDLDDALDDKVDKVTGKGLSTNDYTNTDKAEVAKVANKADKTATATGESLSLVPTSEGRALLHTAYGMSTQSGIPTPSVPVDIVSAKADLRSVGKQLIPYPYYSASGTFGNVAITDNGDGSITLNGTCDAQFFFTFYGGRYSIEQFKSLIEGQKYTISLEVLSGSITLAQNGNNRFVLRQYTQNSSNPFLPVAEFDKIVASVSGDFTYSENDGYKYCLMWLEGRSGNVYNNWRVRPMLRFYGTSDTFEPYKHTDITTNLTLRAIEVSSTDNYNLVRDGKYYFADTLDYSEDNGFVVTRRVGEYEVLGTEGWNYVGDAGSKRVYIAQSSLGISAKSGATEQGYSSHFVYNGKTVSSITWGNYYFSGSNLVISANNSDITDITTAESWLSSNKPNFDYILVTPTTETITTEQALALLGLKTYDESTTISSQAEPSCTIAVEYAKERLGALALTAYNMAKGNDLRITALEG